MCYTAIIKRILSSAVNIDAEKDEPYNSIDSKLGRSKISEITNYITSNNKRAIIETKGP